MGTLAIKRIFLSLLLMASIFGVGYYEYLSNQVPSENIERLIVNRKQKKDYQNLFENTNFKTITVQFTEETFQQLLDSMTAHFEEFGDYQDNTMHKVTLHYQDGKGNDFAIEEVGFRTKSNTSRNLPMTRDYLNRMNFHQTSFQLQFDATFDYPSNSNEYAVLKGREVFDLDQLNFEYTKSFEGAFDRAMISEDFAYQMYREAGVATSNTTYGLVYFQIGNLKVGFGMYTMIEPIDNEFLRKNFNSDAIGDYGDLYKVTDSMAPATLKLDNLGLIGIDSDSLNVAYSFQLKNNTLDGTRMIHEPLSHLIETINSDYLTKTQIENLLDVDSFLRAIAIGFLIGNTDDYRCNFNNYYLYFHVYSDQVVYIPFDLDNVLGFGKHQDITGNMGIYYELFSPSDEEAALLQAVFAVPEWRAIYLDYLEQFATTLFDYDLFLSEYQNAKTLYEAKLIEENHLGNQYFNLRNSEWYFINKKLQVLDKLEVSN